jgi:hypothetical protein
MKAHLVFSLAPAIVMLSLCAGSAQNASDHNAGRLEKMSSAEKCIIRGQAINSSSRAPIPNARITLRLTDSPQQVVLQVKTDAEGHFSVSVPQPGKYLLGAEHVGFLERGAGAGPVVELSPGQTLENVTLALVPQSVIAGVVVQADGSAFTGALVSAERASSVGDANGAGSVWAYAYTNDLGEYRLFGLPAGRYFLHVSHRETKTSFYYPHALVPADAAVLEVEAGNTLTGINLSVRASMDKTALLSPKEAQGATASVEGRVVNSITGGPVPLARVWLDNSADDSENSQANLRSLADAVGDFTLRNVQPGAYRLSASRRGFILAEHSQGGAQQSVGDVVLTAGQSLKGFTVELTPTGVIAGKALGEDGDPLANAVVVAIRTKLTGGRRELSVVRRVYTNDLGEFRLYDLPAGRYYVSAFCRDTARGSRAMETSTYTGFPPAYYPNATRLAEASSLNLEPGSTLGGVDLILPNLTQVHLRGRVFLPASRQLTRNVLVSLTPSDLLMAGKYSRRSAEAKVGTGEFQFEGVPPGEYVLAADWPDEGKQYSATQIVNIGKTDVDGVMVALLPAAQIRGQVRLEGENHLDLSGLHVFLHTAGQAPLDLSADGSIRRDGAFTIENLRPAQYSVSVSGLSANYYLKAVYCHAQNVTHSGIDLTQGGPENVELVLSPDGGSVAGMVQGETPARAVSATVALIPDAGLREGRELYRTVATDETGRFNLNGIAPGHYRLVAFDNLDSIEEPMIFNRLGDTVTIEEHTTATVQLNLVQPQ